MNTVQVNRVTPKKYEQDYKYKKYIDQFGYKPDEKCYIDVDWLNSDYCHFNKKTKQFDCTEKCMKYTYIICPICEERSCYSSDIDMNNNYLSYFCQHCENYYNCCVLCFKESEAPLAQLLISHNYEEFKSDVNSAVKFEVRNKVEDDEENEYFNFGEDTELVIHSELYHFPTKILGEITGPDGGYYSTWKCSKCLLMYELEDK